MNSTSLYNQAIVAIKALYTLITKRSFIKRIITASIITIVVYALYMQSSPIFLSIGIATTLLYILLFEWPYFKQPFLTPLYPVLPLLLIIALNQGSYRILLCFCTLIAASYDMGAYVTGTVYGKHKLAPSISPKKTIEGLWGGIVCAVIAGWLLYIYFALQTPLCLYTLVVIVGALCAASGDLLESWLKRVAHLKDAGSILPGHGGFLDRLDSLFIISALVYITRKSLYTWLFF
jgi:phosphatidate cytidylyltransferase